MVYKILEYCVKCGGCSFECPVGAITEGDKTYVIDPEKCTDCGLCIENNHCTAWAIVKEYNYSRASPACLSFLQRVRDS